MITILALNFELYDMCKLYLTFTDYEFRQLCESLLQKISCHSLNS